MFAEVRFLTLGSGYAKVVVWRDLLLRPSCLASGPIVCFAARGAGSQSSSVDVSVKFEIMARSTATESRKREHLRLCAEGDVEFSQTTTLLEDVSLVHQAVPTRAPGEVDTGIRFLKRRLRAPLVIGAMTGGTRAARKVNRDLARVAREAGIGLALGSQRAMVETPSLKDTYEVRDLAPDCLLLGNIGLFQAMRMSAADVRGLMESIGADGMCLHLNAAMEIFQREGDEKYGSGIETITALAEGLGERLIVKETGCGISRETALTLVKAGVRVIDVAGAGGASWVKVENLRSRRRTPRELRVFEEWGIPTAASLCELAGIRAKIIASGGLRSGLDMARALALGADVCSCALPFLRAHAEGGAAGAQRLAGALVDGLRAAMALTNCGDLRALKRLRPVITGRLAEWVAQRRPGRKRNG